MKIKKLLLLLVLVFSSTMTIYAGEKEVQKTLKVNNQNISAEIKVIDDTPYIDLNVLAQFSSTYFVMADNGKTRNGYFNNKYLTLSTDDNFIYHGDRSIYSKRPKLISNKMYITIDSFANILRSDLTITDKYYLVDNYKEDKDYSFTENELVAHGLGAINGVAITNSKEAFIANYEKGFRVFEVDLQYTIDGYLVAAHDFNNPYVNTTNMDLKNGVTYLEFISNPVFNEYTPLTFEDVVKLMAEYEDVYIITDTKYTDANTINKQFNKMVEITKNIDEKILDRIIPQAYSYEMYSYIDQIYNFKSYIITLYLMKEVDEDYLTKFAYENGIGVITMDIYRATDSLIGKLDDYGIKVYVHTINTEDAVTFYKNKGVSGFYTDTLVPKN